MAGARYLVGVDLGTTHTVVAFADLERRSSVELFAIEQLVSAGEVAPRALLPSCLYVPLPGEIPASAAQAPGADPPYLAGEHARRRGAETPGRVVLSAKSWLCHPGVDRTEAILPWGSRSSSAGAEGASPPSGAGGACAPGEAGEAEGSQVPLISPVDASAQLLRHVRRAWDRAHPEAPLAEQELVLTVPASFDEAARELTVLALGRAGLSARLLEEPQAAFYDWMRRGGDEALSSLLAGREASLVLVCDVGGGTTDLSLIRVERGPSGPRVLRVAVGDHLLLGGDNMDLALAHACERRLSGGERLSPSRFGQLVSACRAAKEALLGDEPPDEAQVTLLGQGSRLLGGVQRTTLSRDEAERLVLDGFFPVVGAEARPERGRSALVSFGLPYARDTAITRHLAHFLARHGEAGAPARPDAVVLNGGVFHARAVAERLSYVMARWAGMAPRLLPYADPDLAVARGAVAYGLALRGEGRKIEGGSSRAYYVGVGARAGGGEGAPQVETAVCVIPRGGEEGVRYRAPQRLMLTVGRPARFELFASSDDRGHAPGDVVAMDEERFARLPPVFATLPSEATAAEVPVALEGELTPIGTLDLACAELDGPSGKRHRLAFRLRGAAEAPATLRPPPSRGPSGRRLDEALSQIGRVFGKSKEPASPREVKDLVRDLERVLGERSSWTTELSRTLFDALMPLARSRRRSADHERMFWSIAGYALRPGFGYPADEARVAALAPLLREGITHSREPRVWQQFWIAWRRVAGGLDEPTQVALRDLADPFLEPGAARRKVKGPKPEALDELLSLSSWLERVPADRRAALGGWVIERMWTDRDGRLREALGRLGAREPAYASAHYVVPPQAAERFLDELLREKWPESPASAEAAFKIARLTGDRARDIPERLRREVIKRLEAAGASPEKIRALSEVVARTEAERAEAFGESLPVGLRLA